MKIGIIGGTGGMGKGFAIRWSVNHDILIGSREATRAKEAADEYINITKNVYEKINGTIIGKKNLDVAKTSDVLVLSIPYDNIESICSSLLHTINENCIVISPIVPMIKTELGFEFLPMKYNKPSSYQVIKKYMKDHTKLISAFHVISEKKLVNPNINLDYDVFVCGDSKDAIDIVNKLIMEIKNLRPLYLGKGELSYFAEIATPLLLNAMIRNRLKNPGFKIC